MKRKEVLKGIFVGLMLITICAIFPNSKVMADDSTQNNTNTQNTIQTTNNTNTQSTTTVIQTKEKKDIKSLKSIINTNTVVYTGKEKTPSVKLYDGKKKLKRNRDYTLEYSKNTNVGKAKIVVKGIGDYKGTIKKYFYIAPKKAKIKSVMFNSTFTQATVEWEKDKMATGYVLSVSTKKDGKYKKLIKTKSKKQTKCIVKKLNPNKMYYFKVCSYKLINNKTVYSPKESNAKSNTGRISKISLISYSSGKNRNFNLNKACRLIDGTILRPGDSFNWFRVVGPASAARGYRKASVFVNKKTVLGYGGGVCQVSTTVYQAAVEAGLKITERHQHSKPVSYTSSDKDATVTYGVNNLRFRNNKDYKIRIVTYSNGGRTTCEMYRVED